MKRLLILLSLCLALACGQAFAAETLTLAAGAGYKKMVEDLSAAFEKESGIKVERLYGNMGQITGMARESGKIDIVAGDKRYLDGTDLAFTGETAIGKGRLVLAVAKGAPMASLEDLTNPAVKRVAMPDAQKAIYGRAADEYMDSAKLRDALKDKLIVVATVPQVSAYVLSGEVDAGFINLTDALAIKDKVERILTVNEAAYKPILIVAKPLAQAPHAKALERFMAFLGTQAARDIAVKHGL
ncbi:MAG TPA: molybdate ABC transporter substrate-binding protein [Desulfovibrio sp.]|jgi:molybdate transport system substrate-binding protein|uniref:molybdate ABC transporter substrate-binding protein n=1 Tax=Desulfovibrio TaxID=872 RepID=UPI002A4B91C7|nr:molybdate ABC transporter substrate-binding protein [Desulfovibrio sp.]MDY0307502.1 molybdate ABC transporter substrate-binding protein [Desulfovibrionaceae bacterium]HMM38329.1 molybdate ABC transporter substrate-binding protein [Desulfovibrio sp.]